MITIVDPQRYGYPIHEMDKQYGCEIQEETSADGTRKLSFRGASTDYCWFPLHMIDKRDKKD